MPRKRKPRKSTSNKTYLQGNAVAAQAALAAGATHFYGYPITPATEIMENWVRFTGDPNHRKALLPKKDSNIFNVKMKWHQALQ